MTDPAPPEDVDGVRALVAVMDRLRAPGGCPWDARQTHRSLVEYLVEEAYETVEAIEGDDREGLREELGDLLLQVVFHARIAEEDPEDPWGLDEVARGIADKLIARHPHVFAGEEADSAELVERRWHERKAVEKGRSSVTEGIPDSLPALLWSAKLLARSEGLGAQIPRVEEGRDIVSGLVSEDELGDLLLGVVAAARARGWDAEAAVRQAARRHRERILAIEGR